MSKKQKQKYSFWQNVNLLSDLLKQDKLILKLLFLAVFVCGLFIDSYAWFYSEYISKGTNFNLGEIAHQVTQYDQVGDVIGVIGDTVTIINEDNIGNTTVSSRYIEIENIGTLNIDYTITFQLDGTIAESGVMYYRIYDITEEMQNYSASPEFPTQLKAYIDDNQLSGSVENDTLNPVSNMSTIGMVAETGEIKITGNDLDYNPKYYRLDYGMYQATNSSLYSDKTIVIHTKVYSTQLGAKYDTNSTAFNWVVENEIQLRNAITYSAPNDIITLAADIIIDGSINIGKRVHLDLNGKLLSISGDLVYDFVGLGGLTIDTTSSAQLEIGNNFLINAPKTEVHFIGTNVGYDIYVGGDFTVNGIQDGELDGILFDNVKIVQNRSSLIPVDVLVMSNTRVTIAPDVVLGFITAVPDSTNIEIINNGVVTQLLLQDMTLLTTFSKPQIYVYNLGVLYGVTGSTSIVLPPEATPYIGPGQGNTLIIKGITSTDITVSGSEFFDQSDIGYNEATDSVIPISNEFNSYIVYIREPSDVLEDLLYNYFVENQADPVIMIDAIQKLVIYTVNAQYFENEDFDFLKSTDIPNIKYLSLSNCRVIDNAIVNQIKASALSGKTSLETVILPRILESVGASAFAGVQLGRIPASGSDPFIFLTIPSSVISIGASAFNAAKYVKFDSSVPPTIADANAFNQIDGGVKFFVPEGSVEVFQGVSQLNEKYIHQEGFLSDNRLYFLYDKDDGYGISLYVSYLPTGDTLTIPTSLTLNNLTKYIVELGYNSYRHITTPVTGVGLIMPTRITSILYSAFRGIKVLDADLSYVELIGDYAFYNSWLDDAIANLVTSIGDYAFYGSTIENASFATLNNMGNYALANCTSLYSINLGLVKTIGDYGLANNYNLTQVFINNTTTLVVNNRYEIDITVGEGAMFSGWGSYTDGRLRFYVPDGMDINNNVYIDLYKNQFGANANYIYLNGFLTGTYQHMAIDFDMGQYMLRHITKKNSLNADVVGLEIIDYHGADLTSSYSFPLTFNVSGVDLPVVSIGIGAFRHTDTVVSSIIDVIHSNVIEIGDYALYGLGITSFEGSEVVTIGDYAFSTTLVEKVDFDKLITIGDYALSGMSNLYSANLGPVKNIGNNAVSNNPDLEQLFLSNTDIANMNITGNPFSDIGTNALSRLRIYVPNTDVYVNFYKTLLGYSDYTYGTGVLVGSYINAPIPYDIGEYMIYQTTLTDKNSQSITGWEIIEYHGADLDSSYVFPLTFTYGGNTYPVISIGRDAFIHTVSSDQSKIDIVSTDWLRVGANAFQNVDFIGNIVADNVLTIGAYAFSGSTLNSGVFESLYSIGAYTFANSNFLYHLNLGTVKIMPSYSVYNLPNLSQIFFDVTDINVTFSGQAIMSVGGSTNGRLRIYVPGTIATGSQTYTDVYRSIFHVDYSDYIYKRGYIVGSYVQPNIPFDIGEFSVSEVTKNNYLGAPTTGWEIVEFHGGELINTYSIPNSITITSVVPNIVHDVIAIGDNAYQHASTQTGHTFKINNQRLIEIGQNAFNGLGISEIRTPYVTTIGAYAFAYSSLNTGVFSNLKNLSSYAFANIPSLYMLDLGSVNSMEQNSLYQLTNLSQVFFKGVNSVIFNPSAITEIGMSTNDRLRLYVTDANNNNSIPYVDMYKALFDANYVNYWFPRGVIIGSYTQSSIPYDIGEHSIRKVILTNSQAIDVTGYEIIEYHGPNLDSLYEVPETLTLYDINLSAEIADSITTPNGSDYIHEYTIRVTNNSTTASSSWQFEIDLPSGTTISSILYGSYSLISGGAIISSISANGSLAPGASTIDSPIITFDSNSSSYSPTITDAKEQGAVAIPYDVISIGVNSYRHADVSTGGYFDITNDFLIRIGDYAFNNIRVVRNLYASELLTIGDYALYNNLLSEVELINLQTVGEYGLASNTSLNYLYLGPVSVLDNGALYGNTGIEQIFFTNIDVNTSSSTVNITLGSNVFTNVGVNAGERVRVYVPSGIVTGNLTYVIAYKNTLPSNLNPFVYQTGSLSGSYTYSTLPYDIGEYMVIEVDRLNSFGNPVNGWEIVDYHGADIEATYNIPTSFTINSVTKDVISIGEYAYRYAVIPAIVNWNCSLGQDVVYVGAHAFDTRGIYTLTGNRINIIEEYAFNQNDRLVNVTFTSVVNVGDYAFYDNDVMSSITLGEDGENYGAYAFYVPFDSNKARTFYIAALTPPTAQESTFPAYSIQVINPAKTHSYYYVTFYVPTSVLTTYRNTAPYINYTGTGYQGGTGQRVLGMIYSGGWVYDIINGNEIEITSYRGTDVTVTIPSQITTPDNNTYDVTSIRPEAFDGAINTTSIVIPTTVKNVGNSFLINNTTINSIYVDPLSTYFTAVNGVLFDKNIEVLIRYPRAKATRTRQGGQYIYTNYNVPNTVKVIAINAFTNVIYLGSITIPTNLAVISANSFDGCSYLTLVTFFGTVPPYMTGFVIFPLNAGLILNVPDAYIATYQAKYYYGFYIIS